MVLGPKYVGAVLVFNVQLLYKYISWCIKLYAPRILYIGQTCRYSPEYTFYIFSQQIYLIFFRLSLAIFVYSPTICCIFRDVTLLGSLYINGVLNCKCPAPGPKG